MINHMRNIHDISCNKRTQDQEDTTNASAEDPTKNSKQKQIDGFLKRSTLAEIVSELATKDGFSIRGITQSNFIRQAISDKGYKLPRSQTTTMALIHSEFEEKKQEDITFFDIAKTKGDKFSITLDEWVSSRQRRYMNINAHDKNGKTFNLGLVRIVGSCNAANILKLFIFLSKKTLYQPATMEPVLWSNTVKIAQRKRNYA